MRIWIIDDQEDEIRPLREFLESKGAICLWSDWSDNGVATLADISEHSEIVVVLDLYFHDELKGKQILERLRKAYPDLPVIILSQRDERMAEVIRDWPVYDYYTKASQEYEKLLAKAQRCIRETEPQQAKLREAGPLATSTDPDDNLRAVSLCDELESLSRRHSPAMHIRRTALRSLVVLPLEKHPRPIIWVLKELRITCSAIADADAGVDQSNLRDWLLACRHLGEGIAELLVACLRQLEHNDALLHEVLAVACRGLQPAPSLQPVIDAVDQAPVELRLSFHLRVARALEAAQQSSSDRRLAAAVAAALVIRLGELGLEEAYAFFNAEMRNVAPEALLDTCQRGDPDGAHVGKLLITVAERLLQHDGRTKEDFSRAALIISRVVRWCPSQVETARLQLACASAAENLLDGPQELRDTCLASVCGGRLQSIDAGKTALDVLATFDVTQAVQTLGRWVKDAEDIKQTGLIEGLLDWAVQNRALLLAAPVPATLHNRIITLLMRMGRYQDALPFLFAVVGKGIAELSHLPKGDQETRIQELTSQLEDGKRHAAGAHAMRAQQLETELGAARARLYLGRGPLYTRRVAVLAGTETEVGPQLLEQYEKLLEELGPPAKHSVCRAEGGRVEGLCESLKHGTYDVIVVVAKTVKHPIEERVRAAYMTGAESGHRITWVKVDSQEGYSVGAVRRVLLTKLGFGNEDV